MDRRICLVAGSSGPGLLQRAAEEVPSAAMLIELQQRAIERGRSLSELAHEEGRDFTRRARDGLLALSCRGLLSLARPDGREALEPRSAWLPIRSEYDRALTFSPLELYERMAQELDLGPADEASRAFEALSRDCERALLLLRGPDKEVPVALRAQGAGLERLMDVQRVAFAAHSLCGPWLEQDTLHSPSLLSFGQSWNQCVCVISRQRIAVLIGRDVEARARIARSVTTGEVQ